MSAQVEGQRAPVELVRAADERTRLLHILERLLRCQCFPDGFLRQMVQVRFEDILGRRHHGQTHRRVLGHLVEQRVDGVPLAGFAGQMSGAGRHAQPVGDQHAVRHSIETPGAMRYVGAWLAEEQPLAEIPPARQLDLAGVVLVGIARQCIEALPILGAWPEHCGTWVEPSQEPVVDIRP